MSLSRNHNLRVMVNELQRMCHASDCTAIHECPMTHDKCKTKLDIQTAMAWILANFLTYFCNCRSQDAAKSDISIHAMVAFAMQAQAQHQQDSWFRKDIFQYFDWIDFLFSHKDYTIED